MKIDRHVYTKLGGLGRVGRGTEYDQNTLFKILKELIKNEDRRTGEMT